MLSVLLFGIGVIYGLSASSPLLGFMIFLLLAIMACLGLGNGAVFQLVPQRFRQQIGIATGVVGAVGGLGGFLLPILLGSLKQWGGSFGFGFGVLALLAFGALIALRALTGVQEGWRFSWRGIQSEVLSPKSEVEVA